jgi:hypothetical protein
VATEEAIDKAIESFRGAYEEVRRLPDQTRETFDQVITALHAASVAGAVAPASRLGVLGITGSLIDIEGKRDQILAGLDKLLGTLKQTVEGIAAPYTFIRYAAEWQQVGGKVREARNTTFDQGDLTGYWEGTAAERYSAARGKQDTALAAADDLCTKVHDGLLTLSESGRQFYADTGTAVIAFLSNFGAALTKISTIIGAPFGVSDAIDLIADHIVTVSDLVFDVTNLVADQLIVYNELVDAANEPNGLPGNKWPKATANAYSDASATDGTPSSWQVSE